jgi:hypothetical protein
MKTYIIKSWAKSSSFSILFASLFKQRIFGGVRIGIHIVCTLLKIVSKE